MSESMSAKSIFAEALEAPAPLRAATLDRLCAGNDALRSEVEDLLAVYAEAGRFLGAAGSAPDIGAAEAPGAMIGPYRLLEEIGEGGFGVVFSAEQQAPMRRRVALKVIKLGMDTRQVIARFEAERQALAMMDHPGIARVLDAGATSAGRPYFVMELAPGAPITEYCDRAMLGVEGRLALFRQVCSAVQHAHQKGVIHRDIKPSNVLVVETDDGPAPKVIDFGIAKATSGRLTERTLFTGQGQLIGTPEYMSPEQADRGAGDVDTRSDIYSLGVLLYELLTGATPFDPQRLRSAAFGEIQRIIREEEPVKPSTRLSSLAALPSVAASRGAEPARLSQRLRGDLDWIVMRCLEKDPARRYETASALARDLERHAQGEPVEAAPPVAAYRVRKFVRRHRAGVLTGAAVAAALVLAIIGTSTGMAWALREKSRADGAAQAQRLASDEAHASAELASRAAELASLEAERAGRAEADAAQRAGELEQVAAFQAGQLADIDPHAMGLSLRDGILEQRRAALDRRGAEPEAADAIMRQLEEALAEASLTNVALDALNENIFQRALIVIDRDFADQPLVKARLLQSIAETMRDLGLLEAAVGPQTGALELRQRDLGDEDPETLTSMNEMGRLLMARGRPDEAERCFRDALDGRRRILGEDHRDTLTSVNNMGFLLQTKGKLAEAEACLREAVEKMRRTLGDDHVDTLSSITNLGALLLEQGKPRDAEPYYREAMEGRRRILGDDHPLTLLSINNMSYLLQQLGDLDGAEAYRREALEGRRRVLGNDHPETLTSINNMGFLLQLRGMLDEAEPYFREALEGRRRVLGEDHERTLTSINNLGVLLLELGRPDDAEPYYRRAMEGRLRVLGEDHPHTLISINNTGYLLRARGELADAEPYFRRALDGRRRVRGPDHPETIASMNNLCVLLRQVGSLDESERLGAEAVERARTALGARHGSLGVYLGHHAHTLLAMQRFADAEPELLEAHAILSGARGHRHMQTIEAAQLLIQCYDAWHAADPGAGHDADADRWRATFAQPPDGPP